MTLVESMVAGTIGVIVALGVLTVVNVHSREVAEGTVHGILQVQSEVVYDIIGREVRSGTWVHPQGRNDSMSLADTVMDSILVIADVDTALLAAFKIPVSDDTLRHWNLNGGGWVPVKIGGDTVRVDTPAHFVFAGNRKRVSVVMPMKTAYHGREYSIPSRGGQFACRN
jgi:hypothetical protein